MGYEYLFYIIFVLGISIQLVYFIWANKQLDKRDEQLGIVTGIFSIIAYRKRDPKWSEIDFRGKMMRVAWYIQITMVITAIVIFCISPDSLLLWGLAFFLFLFGVPLHFVLKKLERVFSAVRYSEATGDTRPIDDMLDDLKNPFFKRILR